MVSCFVDVQVTVEETIDEQENENATKKTEQNVSLFKEFVST
jgi:hypothetical protein